MSRTGIMFIDTVHLVTTECAHCGVMFALPKSLDTSLRESGAGFFCPSGHSLVYKSKIKELETRLEQAAREIAAQKRCTEVERAEKEEAKAEHAKLLKTGKCPCCRRNFSNLVRHMKHMHPDFKP